MEKFANKTEVAVKNDEIKAKMAFDHAKVGM